MLKRAFIFVFLLSTFTGINSKNCKKIKKNVLMQKCLTVCGKLSVKTSAYGYFVNTVANGSPYAVNSPIDFNLAINTKNSKLADNGYEVIILNPGIYYVGSNLSVSVTSGESYAIQLFLNGSPIADTSRAKLTSGVTGSDQAIISQAIIHVSIPNSTLTVVNVGTHPLKLVPSNNNIGNPNIQASLVIFNL